MRTSYDEFSMLADNAAEVGLPEPVDVTVERVSVTVDEQGRQVSALKWGEGDPEIVLLHGGAQNAHTWDTVALALGRPLVAIDLPGHGHSDWRDDHDYSPWTTAAAVAEVMEALAPSTHAVVANAFGGLVAIAPSPRRVVGVSAGPSRRVPVTRTAPVGAIRTVQAMAPSRER